MAIAKTDFTVDFQETPFLETSTTAAHLRRLNWRSEILLTRNLHAVQDKKVLDLACHDGRFSYACLALGARRVTGVEGRAHLVEHARKNLSDLQYGSEKVDFVHADLFDYLVNVKPGDFDTILCFGVFYHMIKQIELLQQISRIKPAHFILDTFVAKEHTPKIDLWRIDIALRRLARSFRNTLCSKKANEGCLVFKYENYQKDGATIDPAGLIAWPSRSLMDALFRYYGFTHSDIDWRRQHIDCWDRIKDYKTGKRASWIAEIT